LGNFGLAILGLTVIVNWSSSRFASASYRAMSKMKKLQPQMEAIKKEHADDPQKMQLAMMEMYKREKANPVSAACPSCLTIPVFFSLYRSCSSPSKCGNAPFYGWIHDLSAPDPPRCSTCSG